MLGEGWHVQDSAFRRKTLRILLREAGSENAPRVGGARESGRSSACLRDADCLVLSPGDSAQCFLAYE